MQIFKQVVAAGSFTKAAALLHQPKSRVSRNISALERELGVQLIYRTTRQFRLTEAGRDLYTRSLAPLNELSKVLENISAQSDELAGPLRVTAPEDLGVVLLADVCRAFTEIHPKVKVEMVLTGEVLDLVRESIDVAIRIGKLKDSSLTRKKIGKIRSGLFMSPTLRAQSGSLTRLEDLERVPFLQFSGAKARLPFRPRSVFTANNHLVLRSMAAQGMGFGLIPLFLVQEDLRQGRLVPVFSDWAPEEVPIQVVIPQQREPLPRVKRFMEFAASQMAPYFI